MLAFFGYSSVMLLGMKAWHYNVFFKLKHENQILKKIWWLLGPVREKYIFSDTKGQTQSTMTATTMYVLVMMKYVGLCSKFLGVSETLPYCRRGKLWYCRCIYCTCVGIPAMPITVCIGFANKRTVIAASQSRIVTFDSTQSTKLPSANICTSHLSDSWL